MSEKTRADGEWTEARFIAYIKSQLRNASVRWPPKNKVMQAARQERGVYLCNGCKKFVPASVKKGSGRTKNVFVDHIAPVVDPSSGFTSWDSFINNLFCDSSNLQVLCLECHSIKTAEERRISNERAKKEKNNDVQ